MEFDDIMVKENPGICRCCLSEGCYKDMASEYSWMSDTEVYADMLLECFDISISQHNEGPNGPNRLICEVCITRLRDACNFKKTVLDSEKRFVDMIAKGDFRSKAMSGYQQQLKIEVDEVDLEHAPDAVDFLDDDMDYVDDESKHDDPSISGDITVAALPIKNKRGRPRKTSTIVKSEKKSKIAKTEEKAQSSKVMSKDENPDQKFSANRVRRRNLQILFNNTTMIPFKWRGKYMCFYCGEDVPDYDDLRKHTRAHGECTDKDRAIRLVKARDAEVKIDVSDITCDLCEEIFPDFDEIVSHLIFKHRLPYNRKVELSIVPYRLRDLKCLQCEEQFKHFSKLIVHVNTDHPSNCFLCHKCNSKFNKKRDLDSHLRVYHKNEYTCNKCSVSFDSMSELQTHKANAHTSVCNICFLPFSSSSIRLRHMKEQHGDAQQCGFCKKILNTKQGFLRHATKCEASSYPVEEIMTVDDTKKTSVKQVRNNIACVLNMSTAIPFKHFMNRFRCFYCPKDFTECSDLKQHTVVEHPLCDTKIKSMRLRNREESYIKIDISTLSCKLCYESMPNLDTLIDHLITEHKARYDKIVETNLQPYKLIKDHYSCPDCGETYRYFSILLKHISRTHTNNRNVCVYCGTLFRTDANLRAHISRTHKAAAYKCLYCDMEFVQKNDLRLHMGKIHGKNFAQCNQCSEKFKSQYAMQRHMINVHNIGHKCNYCGKLFTKNSFMVNHVRRTHLKEKNVECAVCYERFFDIQRLKMHMVKHIGERNFHCDICGKKFLWKKNLRGHMSSHIKHSTQAQLPPQTLPPMLP